MQKPPVQYGFFYCLLDQQVCAPDISEKTENVYAKLWS